LLRCAIWCIWIEVEVSNKIEVVRREFPAWKTVFSGYGFNFFDLVKSAKHTLHKKKVGQGDEASQRLMYAILKNRNGPSEGKQFAVVTGHFKSGEENKDKPMQILHVKELSSLLTTFLTLKNMPVIFACDFNKSWESAPVQTFRTNFPNMTSAYDATDKKRVSSKKLRKAGEQTNKIGERIEHTIDYIFTSKHFTKRAHLELPTVKEVEAVTRENGLPCWKFPSDHFNLVADFDFNPNAPNSTPQQRRRLCTTSRLLYEIERASRV
jgi:endonuclease/exonuclease/phosphatase family metal-dependent hydrolase